jgi:integrase
MASVTPRVNKDGVVTSYRVQFRIDQKMVGESFPDVKAATDFGKLVDRVGGKDARHILAARQNPHDTPTFAQWVDKYLDPESGIITGIQPATRANYRQIADNSLNPRLGEIPIDAIQKTDIGKWVAWQEQQPSRRDTDKLIAAKTMRNYHALLSNILKAAVEHGLRSDNPARGVRVTEGVSREGVFLTPAEFAAIHHEIPDYYKPLVTFLVATQARWSEATAVTWADVHDETVPPTIRINKAWKKNPDGPPVVGVTKSKRGRRTVSVWPELVALLGERGRPGELVFKGVMSGNQIWYGPFNSRIWRPAVERAAIEKRPNIHDLRHTGASWLIADGVPLPFIQARLGHESITVTVNTYGHLLPDAHTSMADSLSATLSGVVPKQISALTDTR